MFDGPAAPCERDQVDERRGRREMDQIILADVGGRAFTEQPAITPARRRAHAQRAELGGERAGLPRPPGDGLPRVVGRGIGEHDGGQRARHVRDGEGRLAADGDAIGEAEPFEPGAERGVRAVVGVDDHAGDRKAGLQDSPHLGQRDAPLLAKPDGGREAGHGAPRGIVGPRRGHVQVERQRPGAAIGDQRAQHGDLAIAHLPERAAVPAAARRATACPAWESRYRRSQGCPCGGGRRRAAASRRVRPPTANA